MDSVAIEEVQELLLKGLTYKDISIELKRNHPHINRGLSERSVRRFIKSNDLRETVKCEVREVVRQSIAEVSRVYSQYYELLVL